MFYCGNCQKKNEWPWGFAMSYGTCEMCHMTGPCYDVHHSKLPDKEYICPVCEVRNKNAYLTCQRPDCTDGRDPR